MRRKKLVVGLVLLGLAAIAAIAGIAFRRELWLLVDRLLVSEVKIRIETSPEKARVLLDGAEILSNPIQLRRSSQRFTIRIEAPGHRSRSLTIQADASRSYRVVLEPLPRRPRTARATATPRPAAERCPPGMQLIPGELPICIDRHEHPGRGRLPSHGVTLAEARRRCHARGAKLCTADEWLRACGRRFPYGDRYLGDRCNTGGGKLLPSGSKPRCRSGLGVYDLSGNASEWVEDGVALGGDAGSSDDAVSCAASSESGTPLTGFRCCADPPWD